jgi:hypothetical protein
MINTVNDYIKGKKNRNGESHVRCLMMIIIERECGIHRKGIEVGSISFTRYKKEVKRREKYWAKVRAGEITDTRRGFDRERGELS